MASEPQFQANTHVSTIGGSGGYVSEPFEQALKLWRDAVMTDKVLILCERGGPVLYNADNVEAIRHAN